MTTSPPRRTRGTSACRPSTKSQRAATCCSWRSDSTSSRRLCHGMCCRPLRVPRINSDLSVGYLLTALGTRDPRSGCLPSRRANISPCLSNVESCQHLPPAPWASQWANGVRDSLNNNEPAERQTCVLMHFAPTNCGSSSFLEPANSDNGTWTRKHRLRKVRHAL